MVESYHAWTINTSQAADPHLATDLEGRFVGNRFKQLQSDVVEEEVGSQKSVSSKIWMETQGGDFELLR